MFTAKIIGFCFIFMMVAGLLHSFFLNKGFMKIARVTLFFGFLTSIYSLVAGIFLLSGWQDPLAGADPFEIAKASIRGNRKGGIIILLIKYFPYVLVVAGCIFTYINFLPLTFSDKIWRLYQEDLKKNK
jgi:hypothetical protein